MTNNETNNTQTTQKVDLAKNSSLVNLNIVQSNISYIQNVANNTQTKNDLVQSIFFDYLSNKADYKKEMELKGFIEPKNKEVAKYYFSSLTLEVAKNLFSNYGIELKEEIKEGVSTYKLTNTKNTLEGVNIIKGAKEYLRNNQTLLELISTNNLKLRIKLIDFSLLKSILSNLSLTNTKGETLKALINNLDTNLSDIEYIKAIKFLIKSIKEENKPQSQTIDLSKLTNVSEIDTLIETLKEIKKGIIEADTPNETQSETFTGVNSDTLEILED